MNNVLPYLTSDLPGIGGKIKDSVEDFLVEEIPLYQPSGRGTHAYFRVRKVGVPTPVAVNRIARYMGVSPMEIGVAGLKDSQAVTIQTMSMEYADERKLLAFRDAAIKITDVSFHNNKLRIGHLAGNRFVIRIRGVNKSNQPAAQAVLDMILKRGAPNFFGEQRFGSRGDTGELGAAMVRGDFDEFVKIFLGRSRPEDPKDCRAARDAFDAGCYDRAMKCWPRHYVDQRRALAGYKRKNRAIAAMSAIDRRMKRLFVSAFQSEIFNEVLKIRLGLPSGENDGAGKSIRGTYDRVMAGDLAEKTDSGGIFPVTDPAADKARAEKFEISPTGPIVGYRCNLAQALPGQIERDVLASFGVSLDDFHNMGALSAKGSRRPLRFPIYEPTMLVGQDKRGDYIELAFTAPSGCYATIILREIMKTEIAPADGEEEIVPQE